MEVAENCIAGVFRKFISENTSIPVFGNELPKYIRSSNFFVFYFVSHINRFQLFTGTCLLERALREERILKERGERGEGGEEGEGGEGEEEGFDRLYFSFPGGPGPGCSSSVFRRESRDKR